jgi:hypothetical protein
MASRILSLSRRYRISKSSQCHAGEQGQFVLFGLLYHCNFMVVHAGICTAVAVFFHIVVRYGSPILI